MADYQPIGNYLHTLTTSTLVLLSQQLSVVSGKGDWEPEGVIVQCVLFEMCFAWIPCNHVLGDWISFCSAQVVCVIFRIRFWTFLSHHESPDSVLSEASGPFSLVPSCWKLLHQSLLKLLYSWGRSRPAHLPLPITPCPPPVPGLVSESPFVTLDLRSLHLPELSPITDW